MTLSALVAVNYTSVHNSHRVLPYTGNRLTFGSVRMCFPDKTGEIFPVYTTKVNRRSIYIGLPTLNLGTRWIGVVSITPRPLYSRGRSRVLSGCEEKQSPKPVWTFCGRKMSLYPTDNLTLKENIALGRINNLVFVMESQFVFCDVGLKYLNAIDIQYADIFSLYCLMLTELKYILQTSCSKNSALFTGFHNENNSKGQL